MQKIFTTKNNSNCVFFRIPRRALLIGSLILMMLANLGAGLALLDKKYVPEDEIVDKLNDTQENHVVIVDADNLVGVEVEMSKKLYFVFCL